MHPLFFATQLLSTVPIEPLLCWDPDASIIHWSRECHLGFMSHEASLCREQGCRSGVLSLHKSFLLNFIALVFVL